MLDEPTTGLDVTTQRHILDTIRSMCQSYGVAAVYVSHDLAVISGLVAQVAVMYAGRVIEIGPTRKVFDEPVHPYTRGLLAAVPVTGPRGAADGNRGAAAPARAPRAGLFLRAAMRLRGRPMPGPPAAARPD